MLSVKNIEKSFGDKKVLDGISLTVNQGDVVVILGPSGSGKTTFLRSLNYLEKADAGELILDGKTYDLAKISRKDVLEIRKKQPLFSKIIIYLLTKRLLKIFWKD